MTPLEAQFPKKFSDSDGEVNIKISFIFSSLKKIVVLVSSLLLSKTTFWETMKSRVMVEQVVRQTQAQVSYD